MFVLFAGWEWMLKSMAGPTPPFADQENRSVSPGPGGIPSVEMWAWNEALLPDALPSTNEPLAVIGGLPGEWALTVEAARQSASPSAMTTPRRRIYPAAVMGT